MLRVVVLGLGFALAMGGGVLGFVFVAGQQATDVAALDGGAGLAGSEQSSVLSSVGNILPWTEATTEPLTRPRALANRDALRQRNLNSFMPEAPEGWDRLEWNEYFDSKFGTPDDTQDLAEETFVYLKGRHSVFLRIKRATPTGPMIADLLQLQRFMEGGGDLSTLEGYRPQIAHTIDSVRAIANGRSVNADVKYWHFEKVQGVSYIIGEVQSEPNDLKGLRFYHGSLGGGVIVKVRSDAPSKDVLSILQGLDYDGLNQMQDVMHPMVGSGQPEFVLNTPKDWLDKQGFKLRKVKRVVAQKQDPSVDKDFAEAMAKAEKFQAKDATIAKGH